MALKPTPSFRARIILAILASIGMVGNASHAEDIDIYKANPSTADNPNVLIVLDNSTNWSRNEQHWDEVNGGVKTTQGEMELKALRAVIGELSSDINVGLMMLTEAVDGGYIRFNTRPMDAANKTALQDLIGNPAGCTDGPNSVNATPNCILQNYDKPVEKVATAKANYSSTLFEIFKYFGGYTSPANANNDVAGTPTSASQFGPYRYSGDPTSSSWRADSDAFATQWTTYDPPITTDTNCAKTYVIWIGNDPNLNVDTDASLLSGVGGNTNFISLPDLAATTASQEYLLETSACGAYTSVAECASTADDRFPDYDSYRCEEAATCSAGGTTSVSLGVSACGQYSTAGACEADLAATHGTTYSGYRCTPHSACPYTSTLTPPAVLDNQATCISASNANACVAYAQATWGSSYATFSCSDSTNSGCSGGSKKWKIVAGEQKNSGTTYAQEGTATVATASASHRTYGTTSFNNYTTTGTYSIPSTNNYADEWTRFLHQTDINAAPGQQNVSTYVIDVRRLWKNDGDRDKTRILMSMAKSGGGKYFNAQDENAIKNALRRIFAEIQSVNSVFASSSLPVSVTEQTQSVYLNQVFIGMFRPSGTAEPRWPGNLKQYKFKFFSGALRMADQNDQQAVSSTTGFIAPCASSFWTSDTGNYWYFSGSGAAGTCSAIPSSYPTANSSSFYSDAPDGDIVEKGGAAQKLRDVRLSGGVIATSTRYNVCAGANTPGTAECRKLLTCDGSSATSCTSLYDFTATATGVTDAALGTPVTVGTLSMTKESLVDWIRGKDVDDENSNSIQNEMRPSTHGGVVHSQPAVVDYGGTTGVVAYYGADDGVLHAVDGDQAGTAAGIELWSFIAPETFSKFKRLRANEPLISFPGVIGGEPKDYFFDGSIAVFQRSGTVWVYPAMRRGGRAIYAFDVSDPATPSLLWRKGCFTNNTGLDASCSVDWSDIGQTWSKPQLGYLSGYASGGSRKPVLIFGGGYDTCEDANDQTRCTGSRKGAHVWIIDAQTGAIIRKYPTNYSVPGDVSLLKDAAGDIKRIYATDTGGFLYRINVGSYDGTAPADITAADWVSNGWVANSSTNDTLIGNLSETNQQRKFLFGPDVVEYETYIAVLAGSGDREHPLVTDYACYDYGDSGSGVTNQFYMIKDKPLSNTAYPAVRLAADLTDVTTVSAATTGQALTDPEGCKFSFNACEQTVNKAITIGGVTYFGTNQPAQAVANSCTSNLGTARSYAIDFETCGYAAGETTRSSVLLTGGLPPSPVGGIVTVDGQKVPFMIGAQLPSEATGSPVEGTKITIDPTGPRRRVYWYMLGD